MKFFDFFWNLLFPPYCLACGAPLDVFTSEALCPACEAAFRRETEYPCPLCRSAQKDCRCLPRYLNKYASEGIHLAEYTKEKSITRQLILSAKNRSDAYLLRFWGKTLSQTVKQRIDPTGMVVTFVPRDKRKKARTGVDQAEDVAKAMAKALGLVCLPLLVHKKSAQQKELSRSERKINARQAFALKKNAPMAVLGKRVLLYDDLMTTGATMAACLKLLRKAGAKEVIPVSIGMTYQSQSTKKDNREPPFQKKHYHAAGRWMPYGVSAGSR